MTEQTYTDLERRVYNFLVEEMVGNGIYETAEIAECLNLPIATIKGVLGSLTKKGKVDCEQADDYRSAVVWPIHPRSDAGFWADSMTKDEILSARI